ncbi:MFS transporter [Rhodotorula toruloides]|uniref:MFS transporter n=1 Tax=Rhodotorula toruloides TaxID=5286 RepID=A0A511KQ15_RHOTO|nr:MFS transporter [Rhodotorula toruloides]
MGRYQYALLVLCGLGWMADNATLQLVAVGAWGWGSYSDAKGRVPAFNLTLCVTAVFGMAAAFAPSFGTLCLALFLLGTGVGGSMPTDGTLFLENVPRSSHYLLTALSVFFSLGAIITSLLGLVILPRNSCPPIPPGNESTCDVRKDNNGWRIMLFALGLMTMVMFLCRVLFFRLHESAKYLVAAERPSAAVIALRRISRINGQEAKWDLRDVVDDEASTVANEVDGSDGKLSPPRYAATGETTPESRPKSASPSLLPTSPRARNSDDGVDEESVDLSTFSLPSSVFSATPAAPRLRKDRPAWIDRLPVSWRSGADEYLARLDELLEPKWKRTTTLIWVIWTLASAGYTIFNVFLPKFLETKLSGGGQPSSQEATLRDYVLYTVSGLPGSLLGAYLVETSLGRAKTLAFATLLTSAGTFVFVLVSSQFGVIASSMAVSLAATLMYAVIYSITPEIFPTSLRGTACGIASALSRLAGIVAPLLTGALLSLSSTALPLLLSAVCFLTTAACAWGLRGVEERLRRNKGGAPALAH